MEHTKVIGIRVAFLQVIEYQICDKNEVEASRVLVILLDWISVTMLWTR